MEEILKQLKKALEYSNKAEGFLSPNEQVTLFSKALNVKGAIVEIGSWKGKSTIMLAYGSIAGNGNKVYAIDPHTGRPDVPEEYLKIDTFQELFTKYYVGMWVFTIVFAAYVGALILSRFSAAGGIRFYRRHI